MLFQIYLTFFMIKVSLVLSQDICNRIPDEVRGEKQTADGRFSLRLKEEVTYYIPGNTYTIILFANNPLNTNEEPPPKFTSFNIIVEALPDNEAPPEEDASVGIFDLGADDAMIKMSDTCRNMIEQTSFIPKSEVQIRYNAPAARSGCVVFKASVSEQKDLWYQDDGGLTLTLCAEDGGRNQGSSPSSSVCCACDEAKYEMSFEGLWSRYTHPKDFPRDSWLTRFSDIIGASHTSDYRFWELGGIATEGLRQVAERGSTKFLETELKSQSEKIRTIIKARGISYPNVTMGKTFAVFRVDSKKHLISLVSMIDPSPDWIVGVSGLELCLQNCSWVTSKSVDLYPFDAGTDSGKTYISPDQPTMPRETISRLNNTYPPDSPFYDPNGPEMKPLARLYLSRERLYDKSCNEGGSKHDVTTESSTADPVESTDVKSATETNGSRYGKPESLVNESAPIDCVVGAWEVGPCSSTTCGVKGTKTKTRRILTEPKNGGRPCPKTEALKSCKPRNCEGCTYSEWGNWTLCTSECGSNSIRQRTRSVISSNGMAPCNERIEILPCFLLPCADDTA